MTIQLSPSRFLHLSVPMLVGQLLGIVLFGVAGVLLLRVRRGEKGVAAYRAVGVLCLLYAVVDIGARVIPLIGMMSGADPFSGSAMGRILLALTFQFLGVVLFGVAGVLLLRARRGEKGVAVHRAVGALCLLFAVAAIGTVVVPTIRFLFAI